MLMNNNNRIYRFSCKGEKNNFHCHVVENVQLVFLVAYIGKIFCNLSKILFIHILFQPLYVKQWKICTGIFVIIWCKKKIFQFSLEKESIK